MPVQLARDDLLAHPRDQPGHPVLQPPGSPVDDRGRLFHVAVRMVDGLGHPVVADREVQQRALGLRSPVPVRRDFDLAHGVGFGAGSGYVQAHRQVKDLVRRQASPTTVAGAARNAIGWRVLNNNDLDPAASTQMFQAFVDRGKAGVLAPVQSAPARSSSSSSSGGSGKVIGIVVALVVVVAVVAFVALHK